ncbi:MAG: hypothetical protein LBF65_02410 [Holosporales bacterium]|jgi:tRNA A37 threonylcarbamoyladenosine modification protein TsaB|nr:hypothetical protein [Holosporales bacterium]
MTLSYFIRGKEFHVEHGDVSEIREASQTHELADKIIKFLSNLSGVKDIKKVILQSGPASFTTLRSIYSIVKGISVTNKDIEIVTVPSFLTYLSIASRYSNSGLLAIPTMRGDFFTCRYVNNMLDKMIIRHIGNTEDHLYTENNTIFNSINLASRQKELIDTELFPRNTFRITDNAEIIYEDSTIYKY